MSQQLSVRFYQNTPACDFESNLLPRCFNLFESLKEELVVENILGVPFTISEDELSEEIEEELGDEPENEDDFDAFEEAIEKELGDRGEFFPVSELLKFLAVYKNYFADHPKQIFQLDSRRSAPGDVLQEDIELLEIELKRNIEGKARLIIY